MLAWEKVITWILVLVIILVIAYFLVAQLGAGEGSAISKLFRAANDSGSAFSNIEIG